ncbi:uncharacterized protein KGF55_004871 [Candida pseudojiufengensis]|uniref:uncharacterized protein n=1 Tax=Candida pseudojiufengensis TaxID=497109 RepID=UPI00222405C9|nr:uncharacterized protein KGF55_004871 [Candida pseudojiufengensis]KAI5960148.1 hypothetical protein KGF55_004871 [Candida pseudojiufengensis]
MAGLLDLKNHLIFYRSYHFNNTNVTIHLICIPIILLTAISMLTPVKLSFISLNPLFNLGSLIAWIYGIYYIALDFKVGGITASILTIFSYFITQVYNQLSFAGQDNFLKIVIGLHLISWIAQFYGHGIHEKRSPALLDNLLGALVLAPFFVSFEIAFWFGYKLDLKKSMDNEAGKNIRDFKAKEKARKKAKLQ